MTEAIRADYEVSSEGAVRHWEIPYARLEDITPTPSFPAAVADDAAPPGTGLPQLCGTILTIDADESIAVIDFTCSMIYRHTVRNVTTYATAVESAWAAMDIGYVVYYDRSATMPAGTYLSLAAADNNTVATTKFGWIVPWSDADAANYPKGGVTASTQTCAVMQMGAGGGA